MRASGFAAILATTLLLLLAAAAPAGAEIRISDLDIVLSDQEITVQAALRGPWPGGFHEAVQSGIPAHVRFTVELWQYHRYWTDQRLTTKVVERAVEYNVVTREYRVAAVKGDPRGGYTTRELADAQRVLSELRALKLTPAAALDPAAIFYVRVVAEVALRGDNSFLTRMAGTAEQTSRQSDYRTIVRSQ
jgi:hypothetical protein